MTVQFADLDDLLDHYGVKGMKWGIRRTAAQLGHKPPTEHQKNLGKAKVMAKAVGTSSAPPPNGKRTERNIDAKTVSDQDLRDAIARIRLEKEFAQITKKEKSAGRQMFERALLGAGEETIKNVTKAGLYKTVSYIGFFKDMDLVGNYVNTQGKKNKNQNDQNSSQKPAQTQPPTAPPKPKQKVQDKLMSSLNKSTNPKADRYKWGSDKKSPPRKKP